MPELQVHIKQFEKVGNALKAADKSQSADGETLHLLEAALNALRGVEVERVRQTVLGLQDSIRAAIDEQLASRRQEVENGARLAGLPYRRLVSADKVGVFLVEYPGREVRLSVGSEKLVSFEEPSGAKVIQRIVVETARLNAALLPREQFFGVFKAALAVARFDGKVSEGKVKIKDLFPYIAAARQLTSAEFRKKPSSKSYVDYTLAMLGYELSRFGDHDEGWACGGERIFNQGPSMSTQQEAVMLPDTTGNPVQVLWVSVA